MKTYEYKKIKIDELISNTWNPNRIDINKFKILVNNIKKDGMLQPILVRPKENKFEIIDGFHRWKASQEAGLVEIDCIIINAELTEAQLKTLAFNSLRGVNDEEELKKLLEELLKSKSFEQIELETGLFKEDIDKNILIELGIMNNELNNYEEKEFDENLEIKHECPKCGYKW